MAVTEDRERLIRAAWEERGKALWNPDSHGRGQLSLQIFESLFPGPPPLPIGNLEFRLVRATMSGQPMDFIVCEGVVVETIELSPRQRAG